LVAYATTAPNIPKPHVKDRVHVAEAIMMNAVRSMFSFNLFVMINIEPDQEMSEKM
jgi:hypothetical protein